MIVQGQGPGEPIGGAWGSRGTGGSSAEKAPSYSSITAINKSVRDSKNILEIRIEKQQGASFNMTMEETETLLRRLGMNDTHFDGVSACPEGKPVILVTLKPTVPITKFLYRNESYMIKEGLRTTTIRAAGKKDIMVTVSGLHPNTKDQAVIRYLTAHGKVSQNEKVVYHVFPGEPGTSLCAGKFNGNRSYVMEIKEPMGSYHIIDGEKISIRYPGQEWSCARCHQFKHNCPGSAVARNCTSDRVMLSEHMAAHWRKIGYKPESEAMNEVDELHEVDIQVGRTPKETNVLSENNLSKKYRSVIVKGFSPDAVLDSITEELFKNGLPSGYNTQEILKNEKTGSLTLSNLEPEQCLAIMEQMHAKKFLGKKIYITSVVSMSPTKPPPLSNSPPSPTKPPASCPEDTPASSSTSTNTTASTGSSSTQSANSQPLVPVLPTLKPKPTKSSSLTTLTDFVIQKLPSSVAGVKEKVAEMESMFPLQNKRKALGSPEVTDPSKREKKINKRGIKNKAKCDLKAAAQIVSPSKVF